jgi:hypothetical protein
MDNQKSGLSAAGASDGPTYYVRMAVEKQGGTYILKSLHGTLEIAGVEPVTGDTLAPQGLPEHQIENAHAIAVAFLFAHLCGLSQNHGKCYERTVTQQVGQAYARFNKALIRVGKCFDSISANETSYLNDPSDRKSYGKLKFLCPVSQVELKRRNSSFTGIISAFCSNKQQKGEIIGIRLLSNEIIQGDHITIVETNTLKHLSSNAATLWDESGRTFASRDCGVINDQDVLCKVLASLLHYKDGYTPSPVDVAAIHNAVTQIQNQRKSESAQPAETTGGIFPLQTPGADSLTAQCFVGRNDLLKDIEKWVDNGPESYCLIHGPAGRGKSTLARRIAEHMQKYRDGDIATVFVPITVRTGNNDPRIVLRHLASSLITCHGEPAISPSSAELDYRKVANRLLANKVPYRRRTLLIIDGLDEEAGRIEWQGVFPENPGQHIRVLALARPKEFYNESWIMRLGWDLSRATVYREMDLPSLSADHVLEAVEQVLQSVDTGLREELARELFRLTEGEPFMLGLHLKDLSAAAVNQDGATHMLASLRTATKGFGDYFERWWREHRRLRGEIVLEDTVYSVLNLLALAKGPLAYEDLFDLLNTSVSTSLLHDLLPTLNRFVYEGDFGFSFHNKFLNDYFAGRLVKKERRSIQQKFANYARSALYCEDGAANCKEFSRYLIERASAHLAEFGFSITDAQAIMSSSWTGLSLHEYPSGEPHRRDIDYIISAIRSTEDTSVSGNITRSQWLPLELRCHVRLGGLTDRYWMYSDETLCSLYETGHLRLEECIPHGNWMNSDREAQLATRLAYLSRTEDLILARTYLEKVTQRLSKSSSCAHRANIAVAWARHGEYRKSLAMINGLEPSRYKCLAYFRVSRETKIHRDREELIASAVHCCHKIPSVSEKSICLGIAWRHIDDLDKRDIIKASFVEIENTLPMASMDRVVVLTEHMLCCDDSIIRNQLREQILNDIEVLTADGKFASGFPLPPGPDNNPHRNTLSGMLHNPKHTYDVHSGIREYYELLCSICVKIAKHGGKAEELFGSMAVYALQCAFNIAQTDKIVVACNLASEKLPSHIIDTIDGTEERALACIEAARHVKSVSARWRLVAYAMSLRPLAKKSNLPSGLATCLAHALGETSRRTYWCEIVKKHVMSGNTRDDIAAISTPDEKDSGGLQLTSFRTISPQDNTISPCGTVLRQPEKNATESNTNHDGDNRCQAENLIRLMSHVYLRNKMETLQQRLVQVLKDVDSQQDQATLLKKAIELNSFITPCLFEMIPPQHGSQFEDMTNLAFKKIKDFKEWDMRMVRLQTAGSVEEVRAAWRDAVPGIQQGDIIYCLLTFDLTKCQTCLSDILEMESKKGRKNVLDAMMALMPVIRRVAPDSDEAVEGVLDEIVNVQPALMPSGRLECLQWAQRVPWVTSEW